jgi:hypothetical protein
MADTTDTPKIPEMVERIARRLAAAIGKMCCSGDDGEGGLTEFRSLDSFMIDGDVSLIDLVTESLKEMREPTEKMAAHGKEMALSEGAHDCEVPMSAVWREMIEAALGE